MQNILKELRETLDRLYEKQGFISDTQQDEIMDGVYRKLFTLDIDDLLHYIKEFEGLYLSKQDIQTAFVDLLLDGLWSYADNYYEEKQKIHG